VTPPTELSRFRGQFGARGRILAPPKDLGPKGDLNDWLRVGSQGDPCCVSVDFGASALDECDTSGTLGYFF
jgi:hypothetical protein